MGKSEAKKLYESKFWEPMGYEDRAKFQIMEKRLCMPFGVFHEAVEKTLGRPVFTHEFGRNIDGLKAEIFDGAEPPSFDEILGMIPADKRVVLFQPTPDKPGE